MTLASMTGFGRARGPLSARLGGSVVVRSVNHRYLDVQVRASLKEELPEAEAAVREEIAGQLQRGRVVAQLNLERSEPPGTRLLVDGEAVLSVLEQLRSLDTGEGPQPPVDVAQVLALPGVVLAASSETVLDEGELEAVRALTRQAVEQMVRMRCQEGERLGQQIAHDLAQVRAFLDWFEPQRDDIRARHLERLKGRLGELVDVDKVDPDRLAQEAVVLADRADVAEEVVRLHSHLKQFEQRLAKGGAVGRTLDFLCQEMNRELNTLASKCREPEVTPRLVDARSATERIREQVQNLE
jgi:uncharacterized protein (TIGR00255 family)